MKVYDYTQIDLSDKYEDLFAKYEENANEPIQELNTEKETLDFQNDALSYIKNEMRSIKLDYIGAKRKAIYGTLEQSKIDDINLTYENIKANLKPSVKQIEDIRRCIIISKGSTRLIH